MTCQHSPSATWKRQRFLNLIIVVSMICIVRDKLIARRTCTPHTSSSSYQSLCRSTLFVVIAVDVKPGNLGNDSGCGRLRRSARHATRWRPPSSAGRRDEPPAIAVGRSYWLCCLRLPQPRSSTSCYCYQQPESHATPQPRAVAVRYQISFVWWLKINRKTHRK